jgi:hypothetical protein
MRRDAFDNFWRGEKKNSELASCRRERHWMVPNWWEGPKPRWKRAGQRQGKAGSVRMSGKVWGVGRMEVE